MKLYMVTTFFGAASFGGDAVYVERLSVALLRRGHEVHVVHFPDAFDTVARGVPPRPYRPPPELAVHPLRTPFGRLGVLWLHQTGGLGPLRRRIAGHLAGGLPDVIHYHNISLIGGPAVLRAGDSGARPVRIMTASEHWLVCPLSLLWRMDREPCERATCVRCTLAAGRPPQWWRSAATIPRAVSRLHALVFPSRHTLEAHRARGIHHSRMVSLPYLLPDDWFALGGVRPAADPPYVAAAGRFVREKGYELLVELMDAVPEVELRLVGAGPLASRLNELASTRPNVRVLPWMDQPDLARLFAGAVAVAVPSRFPETFGYAAAEAVALGTPVLVSDQGALPELVDSTGGGLVCRRPSDWVEAIRGLVADPDLRASIGATGRDRAARLWSEPHHVARYLDLIEECRAEPG